MELARHSVINAEQILAPYFAVHASNRSIFLADLRAAEYALSDEPSEGPSATVFDNYHARITQSITGVCVRLLDLTDEETLRAVIRGWANLYRATLCDLRERHSLANSSDLEFQGINWSSRLNIPASGLIHIDQSSRYAEYWAQRSITDEKVRNSYDSRLRFVKSQEYHQVARMKESGELLVYDGDNLGTPSYDLVALMRRRPSRSPARKWAMENQFRPVVMSKVAEGYFEGLANRKHAKPIRIHIRLVPAQHVSSYVQRHSQKNPLAQQGRCGHCSTSYGLLRLSSASPLSVVYSNSRGPYSRISRPGVWKCTSIGVRSVRQHFRT
jgi:hypothetical protein